MQYADDLLNNFVESFGIIYSTDKISHNVHNLIHIAADVRNFGSLDNFSAFKFESYMSQIKRLLRKNDKPLQQLACRYYEIESLQINSHFTVVENEPSTSELKYVAVYTNDNYILDCCKSFKDSFVLLQNGDVFHIEAIIHHAGQERQTSIIGKLYKKIGNFYTSPCSSADLDIHIITKDEPNDKSYKYSLIFRFTRVK